MLILPLIIIFVAAAAFALGRLSALTEQKIPLQITHDQTL